MNQQPPPGAARGPGEIQATLKLIDFFQVAYRYRGWFILGLLAVALGTIAWAKLIAPVFYRADSRFYVGRSYTPESMPGVAETEVFRGYTSEQYHGRVQGLLAREFLLSADLLHEVVETLAADPERPVDLYAVLGITESDPELRRQMLVTYLERDLLRVMQVENTGFMVFSVELTQPGLAARFNNACLRVLMERFEEMQFGQFAQALSAYEEQYAAEQQRREARARELAALYEQSYYDRYPPIEARRVALEEELSVQAEWLAEMRNRIEKLKLATSAEARAAGQPVQVLEWATPPLKKSRPKTILSTMMTSLLYTFVFMIGLVGVGYVEWLRRARQDSPAGPPAQSD